MYYPIFEEVNKVHSMQMAFGGFNRKLSASESEFGEMINGTSDYYPILSPRKKRAIVKRLVNPTGMTYKDSLVWIDEGKLYIDGEEKSIGEGVTLSPSTKTIVKTGAYLVIFPDKIWYNTSDDTYGYIDNLYNNGTTENDITTYGAVSFELADSQGRVITARDDEYYKTNKPVEGDYKYSSLNGKTVLSQWATSSNMWVTVTTTYLQIKATGIGKGFEAGDGIKITVDTTYADWSDASNIFVNDEGDGKLSVNTWISDKTDDSITITGILGQNRSFGNIPIFVERKMPDVAYVVECNNRLWGCSEDGHEIYCSKLGDFKNWKCYQGVSTDSWASTVGSDGLFTGAVAYNGNPVFFKENFLIRVTISSVGAHAVNEYACKGVQLGSSKSLQIINSVLYYKAPSGVYAYEGAVPYSISDALGDYTYYDAVAGAFRDKYYISMKEAGTGVPMLLVYDTQKGLWHMEDYTDVIAFASSADELYFIDRLTKVVMSVNGTKPYEDSEDEDVIGWGVVTGKIGYESVGNKYCGRINIRLSMEYEATLNLSIEYDSSGTWEHKICMRKLGTRSFSIPIIPRRCDHFRIKLEGIGTCKILSISKTIEEGSDI